MWDRNEGTVGLECGQQHPVYGDPDGKCTNSNLLGWLCQTPSLHPDIRLQLLPTFSINSTLVVFQGASKCLVCTPWIQQRLASLPPMYTDPPCKQITIGALNQPPNYIQRVQMCVLIYMYVFSLQRTLMNTVNFQVCEPIVQSTEMTFDVGGGCSHEASLSQQALFSVTEIQC